MSEKIYKQIEKITKEMYDLEIEYKVYGTVIINAIKNIMTCKFEGDDAGVKAWTEIRDGYTVHRELIVTRIGDLRAEALRLKKLYFEEKEKEAQ